MGELPVSDLTGSFWIAAGTMVFAFLGLCVKYGYKSKCKEVACCCIRVVRDTEEEAKEDIAEMINKKRDEPDTPTQQSPKINTISV